MNKRPKIGNENFKIWLKKLDPMERVEKMSAIAKTQASAGLKGSLIKASLAQLSQRCHVMLIRLSKKDIERYTRRKTEEKFLLPNKCLNQNPFNGQLEQKDDSVSKSYDETQNRKRKKSEELSKKYQELFGDDFDEPQVHNNAIDATNTSVNNYLSTTVNVNIFNSSSSETCTKVDSTTIKRKHENTVLNLEESSAKRVIIDVSLSTDRQSSKSDQHQRDFQKSDLSSKENSKKKLKHGHSKSNKDKSKTKSHLKPCLVPNVNSPEEDPKIKELWSILGMQSPTDRSECIKSGSIQTSGNNTEITMNEASVEKCDVQEEGPLIPGTLKDNVEDPQLSVAHSPTKSLNSDACDPVCKISGTFSLADVNGTSNFFDSPTKESSSYLDRISKEPDILPSEIETIDILDDDDGDVQSNSLNQVNIPRDIKGNEPSNTQSKVGTIRVKNVGLLMQPQLITQTQLSIESPMSENTVSNIIAAVPKEGPLNEINQSSSSQEENSVSPPPPSVEEAFITTYKFYFDESVELKIPKLGELLHLAITDGVRRNDRIKRSEQLSSDDLILDENQRAEKDFNDMMKTRGNEFAPLCEFILDRFDESSKITLFCALFCRILKHAEKIDSANKNYVLEARNVIFVMLSKHNFKNQDILNVLEVDEDEFKSRVQMINNLIEKCSDQNKSDSSIEKQTSLSRSDSANLENTQCSVVPLQTTNSRVVSTVEYPTVNHNDSTNALQSVLLRKQNVAPSEECSTNFNSSDRTSVTNISINNNNDTSAGKTLDNQCSVIQTVLGPPILRVRMPDKSSDENVACNKTASARATESLEGQFLLFQKRNSAATAKKAQSVIINAHQNLQPNLTHPAAVVSVAQNIPHDNSYVITTKPQGNESPSSDRMVSPPNYMGRKGIILYHPHKQYLTSMHRPVTITQMAPITSTNSNLQQISPKEKSSGINTARSNAMVQSTNNLASLSVNSAKNKSLNPTVFQSYPGQRLVGFDRNSLRFVGTSGAQMIKLSNYCKKTVSSQPKVVKSKVDNQTNKLLNQLLSTNSPRGSTIATNSLPIQSLNPATSNGSSPNLTSIPQTRNSAALFPMGSPQTQDSMCLTLPVAAQKLSVLGKVNNMSFPLGSVATPASHVTKTPVNQRQPPQVPADQNVPNSNLVGTPKTMETQNSMRLTLPAVAQRTPVLAKVNNRSLSLDSVAQPVPQVNKTIVNQRQYLQVPVDQNPPTKNSNFVDISKTLTSLPQITMTAVGPKQPCPDTASTTNILATVQASANPMESAFSQNPVPSSSHCHPFVMRRPISGKMRMLFEK